MPDNNVSLSLGSVEISGWTTVIVSRSLAMLSHSFDFNMVDVWEQKPVELQPGTSCLVKIDGKKVLKGYVDKVDVTVDANSHTYKVSGRSKTADLVDCSVDASPGSWRNVTVLNIIGDLIAPFGINLTADTDLGEKVSSFTVNTGESPFEAIQRICMDRGYLLTTDAAGDLVLTSGKRERTKDNLVLGENVFSAEESVEFSNRYATYKMRAQRSGGGNSWQKSNTQISAEATDDGITRYRTKVFTADSEMTNSLAQKRVSWEAQTRAGRSGKVTVRLYSWYQSNGSLWTPNYLTAVDISPLRLTPDSPLLIEEVKFSQDGNGTRTEMKLVREDAYAPEPPKQIKTKPKKKSFGFNW